MEIVPFKTYDNNFAEEEKPTNLRCFSLVCTYIASLSKMRPPTPAIGPYSSRSFSSRVLRRVVIWDCNGKWEMGNGIEERKKLGFSSTLKLTCAWFPCLCQGAGRGQLTAPHPRRCGHRHHTRAPWSLPACWHLKRTGS